MRACVNAWVRENLGLNSALPGCEAGVCVP